MSLSGGFVWRRLCDGNNGQTQEHGAQREAWLFLLKEMWLHGVCLNEAAAQVVLAYSTTASDNQRVQEWAPCSARIPENIPLASTSQGHPRSDQFVFANVRVAHASVAALNR